jgi:hypothetical protein
VVSLLLVIGHCQLCGEEQVDLPLDVHSPFNMSYNDDATKKNHTVSQSNSVGPVNAARGEKK